MELNPKGTQIINPPIKIKEEPLIKILPIELPPAPIEPEPMPIKPIKPEPIKIVEPPVEQQPAPIETIIPTPSYGGGGGGGGYAIYDGRNFDGGMGRDNAYLSDANSTQRENLQ